MASAESAASVAAPQSPSLAHSVAPAAGLVWVRMLARRLARADDGARRALGRVDVGGRREPLALGRPVREALGMRGVRAKADFVAALEHGVRMPEVDVCRRSSCDAAMVMLVVVPGEERATPAKRMLERGEAPGEARVVLRGAQLALGEGVVVARVRAREAGLFAGERALAVDFAAAQSTPRPTDPLSALLPSHALIPFPRIGMVGGPKVDRITFLALETPTVTSRLMVSLRRGGLEPARAAAPNDAPSQYYCSCKRGHPGVCALAPAIELFDSFGNGVQTASGVDSPSAAPSGYRHRAARNSRRRGMS